MIEKDEKIGNISFYDFSEAIDTLFELHTLYDKLEEVGIELRCCDGYDKSLYTINNLVVSGMGLDESFVDEIGYYCYERNFGRNKTLGDCEIDNKKYPLNSTSDLWIWIKALSEKNAKIKVEKFTKN